MVRYRRTFSKTTFPVMVCLHFLLVRQMCTGSIAKSLASLAERADGLRTVDLRAEAGWLDFQNTGPHVCYQIHRAASEKILFPLSAAVRVARRAADFQTIFDFCDVVGHGSDGQTARG
jgi:hypothetical protein